MKYAPHAIFALIVVTLLVGQRFGFVWAGGNGYIPQRTVAIVGSDATYQRGQTISTKAGEREKLSVAAVLIALDENTTLTIENAQDGKVSVKLSRGRLYASGPLTVTTNFTSTTIASGAISVVNYDFLETVTVAPLGTSAMVTTKGSAPIDIQKPVNVHETPPVSIIKTPFDTNAASVADFYHYATE